MNELVQGVRDGKLRAVSRLISLIENRTTGVKEIQKKLFAHSGRARVIGVTGSPGAGKSTLVDQLAIRFHKEGKRVAILAVDPTSPFSGGAILGDRIRMAKVAETPEIYLRSMATRGSLGGVSQATVEAIQVLEAAGFDYVIVETVGVGQAEVDIVRLADTCIVTLVPGMGDSVQAFKAGILEIADIFVVNKADRDGADLVVKDLMVLLSLAGYSSADWEPPIYKSIATKGDGISEILSSIHAHQEWALRSGDENERRRSLIKETIIQLVSDTLKAKCLHSKEELLDSKVSECLSRSTDPFTVAEELVNSTG